MSLSIVIALAGALPPFILDGPTLSGGFPRFLESLMPYMRALSELRMAARSVASNVHAASLSLAR